uniref:Uncharacterized protein n=1 Tax=Oryza sativa subsp. japonica TaxID=39947 RepID=Q688N1_ORYSJ|nr:hypothetical protein [Oryza sativa Japonica Group]
MSYMRHDFYTISKTSFGKWRRWRWRTGAHTATQGAADVTGRSAEYVALVRFKPSAVRWTTQLATPTSSLPCKFGKTAHTHMHTSSSSILFFLNSDSRCGVAGKCITAGDGSYTSGDPSGQVKPPERGKNTRGRQGAKRAGLTCGARARRKARRRRSWCTRPAGLATVPTLVIAICLCPHRVTPNLHAPELVADAVSQIYR